MANPYAIFGQSHESFKVSPPANIFSIVALIDGRAIAEHSACNC